MIAVQRWLAFLLVTLALTANAQDGPIRILVGFPPGGESDLVARLLADGLRSSLGVPVIVDNRPGASGMLAAELLKQAAPDGKTLFTSMSNVLKLNVFEPTDVEIVNWIKSNNPYSYKGADGVMVN